MRLDVRVTYRSNARTMHIHTYSFRANDIETVTRDNELYLIVDGQEILAARHKWYSYPFWMVNTSTILIKTSVTNLKNNRYILNPQIIIK